MNNNNSQLEIKRRHLPHWNLGEVTYFVTFKVKALPFTNEEKETILEHIKEGHTKFYSLIAVVVMPDHVHILFQPRAGYDLSRIMKGTKGVTANKINKLRNATGTFWQDESFDRIVRDQKELDEKLNYMLNNPVKKGLIENPWEYPYWFYNDEKAG